MESTVRTWDLGMYTTECKIRQIESQIILKNIVAELFRNTTDEFNSWDASTRIYKIVARTFFHHDFQLASIYLIKILWYKIKFVIYPSFEKPKFDYLVWTFAQQVQCDCYVMEYYTKTLMEYN